MIENICTQKFLANVDFWNTEVLLNPVKDWFAVFFILLGCMIAGKIASFMLDKQAQRLKRADRFNAISIIISALSRPIGPLALGAGLYVCQVFLELDQVNGQLEKTGPIRDLWIAISKAIVTAAAAWTMFRLVDIVEIMLNRLTSRTETKLDDLLVPLIRKTLRVMIVIMSGMFIAQNIFKWEIQAIITGLGLGGLAFALAAKDSIANLFGSIVIFTDQPFTMGERVKIGSADGIIEEVGFRSTKMRTLSGHLVTIPNSTVANETIENIARRPYLKRMMDVSVTYDTTPAKMNRALEIVKEMLEARSEYFAPDLPGRTYFSDFKSDNLNIAIIYWYAPPDWWEFQQFNHEFNMELLERFNAEAIEFAFPTQTLYLKKGDQDAPQQMQQ